MEVPFKPLLDNVLVREIPGRDYRKLVTGIETPEKYVEDSDRGEVVAAGDGVPMSGVLMPMPLKVGDVVQFDGFAKHERIYLDPADRHRADAPKYYLFRVADIQGVRL